MFCFFFLLDHSEAVAVRSLVRQYAKEVSNQCSAAGDCTTAVAERRQGAQANSYRCQAQREEASTKKQRRPMLAHRPSMQDARQPHETYGDLWLECSPRSSGRRNVVCTTTRTGDDNERATASEDD